MDCKAALDRVRRRPREGHRDPAQEGQATAAKRAGRATKEGVIGHYIHMGGKVGVLVEVNCETDFVARTDDFQALAKEIAMHVAAADPRFVSRDQVPGAELEKEKDIYRAQFAGSGKPDAASSTRSSKASSGSFYAQICLLEQPSVRDPNVTIEQMLQAATAKTGENITVSRFVRFKLGETVD